MMHVCITLEHHQVINTDRSGFADSPEIIALKVNQHDMLGTLLRVHQQFSRKPLILFLVIAARVCACNWSRADGPATTGNQPFR